MSRPVLSLAVTFDWVATRDARDAVVTE